MDHCVDVSKPSLEDILRGSQVRVNLEQQFHHFRRIRGRISSHPKTFLISAYPSDCRLRLEAGVDHALHFSNFYSSLTSICCQNTRKLDRSPKVSRCEDHNLTIFQIRSAGFGESLLTKSR